MFWCATASAGAAYTITIPQYLGRPGSIVRVPVTLDNAVNVAGVLLQVNYAQQIVSVNGVGAGGLGQAFTLNYEDQDGVLTLMLTRTTNLASGSGQLVYVDFKINDGAKESDYTELTIAQFSLSDETGVQRPDWTNVLVLNSGRLTARTSGVIDNAGNGLPDDWEAKYGMDPLTNISAGDPDLDGNSNLQEYAFGLNPNLADGPLTWGGQATVDGKEHLTVSFRRQSNGVNYWVKESTNLIQWVTIDSIANRIGAPVVNLDGTETWTVRGSQPITGAGAVTKDFLRVEAAVLPPGN